jgi:D-arabinose 1-dehydrogenase-like Zn-dependent alcohol dehydrogenase
LFRGSGGQLGAGTLPKLGAGTLPKRGRLMRAMVIPRFGGPELFEERDGGRPGLGPGEVLVRVVVAGTNPVDTKLRADGSFAGLEPPVVLG